MAYSKAKEEKKWEAWKQKEEEQMRQAGIQEKVIERIRASDWEIFKSERRHYEKVYADIPCILQQSAQVPGVVIETAADLLDEIEDRGLYKLLLSVDKLTLEIVIHKMQGYSLRESALKLGISEKSAYRRIDRLKEKIRKFYTRGEF